MNTQFDWRDLLRFDKMIAPTFLTILYYIFLIISIAGSFKLISMGLDTSYEMRQLGPLSGYLVIIGIVSLFLGPLLIRLQFELLIIIFKIYSRLTNIDHSTRSPASGLINQTPFVNPPVAGGPSGQGHPAASAVPDGNPVASSPVPSHDFELSDFWSPDSSGSSGAASPVPPVDIQELKGKVPNWPAVIATLVVLYAIVTPYAQIGVDVPFLGNILGKAYSIKNSGLGMVAVLSAIGMCGVAVAGARWSYFAGTYGVTLLVSVLAFMGGGSIFSDVSNVKSGIAQVGSGLKSGFGQFAPEAGRFSTQMAANAPGATEFLNLTFYLFIIAMAFLGYWTFAGQYRERGLMHK